MMSLTSLKGGQTRGGGNEIGDNLVKDNNRGGGVYRGVRGVDPTYKAKNAHRRKNRSVSVTLA